MTYRFTARVATTEIDPDGYFIEAALAEGEDGSGFIMMFMAGEEEPDDQEAALGMDTHCLVTAGQGTAYGCVREAVLDGNVLRISLDPEALESLRLDEGRSRPSWRRRPRTWLGSARSLPRCSPTGGRTPCPRGWQSDERGGASPNRSSPTLLEPITRIAQK